MQFLLHRYLTVRQKLRLNIEFKYDPILLHLIFERSVWKCKYGIH